MAEADDLEREEEETSPSPADEEESPSSDEDFDFEDDLEDESEDSTPRKRDAEARINQLIAKNKELEERVSKAEQIAQGGDQGQKVPTPPTSNVGTQSKNPEVQRALEFLKKEGFTTQEDLERKLQEIEDRRMLDQTHNSLENKYDGQDGRPAYDKQEVEDYMREKGVYDPEVAYKALHESELLDWTIKQAEQKRKKKAYVEKGGSSTGDQGNTKITREKVAKAMLTPKGRAWYERNRDKILDLHSKGLLK